MKKYLIAIPLIISSCCSGQLRDKKQIENNNKTIEKTDTAIDIINKPDLTAIDKKYIKDTLTDCKQSLSNSNQSISDCNARETKLIERVNLLLPYKVKYRWMIVFIVLENILIFYIINRKRIHEVILHKT